VLGDGIAFAGVSKYPARVKCALLGWLAFKAAVAEASASGSAVAEASASGSAVAEASGSSSAVVEATAYQREDAR
jgi:nitrogen fixation NifU-like protein